MVIVENKSILGVFLRLFRSHTSIVLPVFSDPDLHPKNNRLSLLFVRILLGETHSDFILPFNHNEAVNLPLDKELTKLLSESRKMKFTLNKKELLHSVLLNGPVLDVNLLYYFRYNKPIELEEYSTQSHEQIRINFFGMKNLNDSIPILQHGSVCQRVASLLEKQLVLITVPPGMYFFNDTVLDALGAIESNGIAVDKKKFVDRFGIPMGRHVKDGLVYSEYNPYTSAGRPSNRFGGVNFAALNKSDGTREVFVSRYGESGRLVLIDFESYHLRLIAKLIDYELPIEPVHEYLGKQYFDIPSLTKEQYEESKVITFRMLYGGIDPDVAKAIPFFAKVEYYVDELWKMFEQKGMILSPIARKEIHAEFIEDPNKQKVFNYLIQIYETEMSMEILSKVVPEIKGKDVKLVLYTYDSILLDTQYRDLPTIYQKIVPLMQGPNREFPVRIYEGLNYDQLK